MKRISFLTAIAFTLVIFVSCKNSGTTGLPIPKDAAIVVHINASSLRSKLSWKEIQATRWFKESYQKEEDSLQKKLMDDPANSGINFKSDFVFFIKKQNSSDGYVVFEGSLKDAPAFEKAVKKFHHDAETKKDGDLVYLKAGANSIVSWNNSKFIFMSEIASHSGFYADGTTDSSATDSLIKFSKDLYGLSKNNSLESDDRFTSLLKETGDVHFWMNMEQYMSSLSSIMGNNPMMSMMQGMNSIFKGNIGTGTLSFDNGKITVKTKKYLGEEMRRIMDKYQYKNVTEDEVNRIPSQNVDAAIIFNYPPEASKELLKTMGLDGFINGFLGKYNYSLDELIAATKGQFILSASDFSVKQVQKKLPGTNYNYPSSKPSVKLLLGLSINNKASFDKLINIAREQIKDSTLLSKINFKSNNEWFAISNAPEAVDQFLAGGNNKLPFAAKITGHPFGIYIDLEKIMKEAQSNKFIANIMDSTATNIWQDIVATGGDYKNGIVTSEFSINLVDKNTNSLKQLNQYADNMYKASGKKEAEYYKNFQNDSTTMKLPSAPDTSAAPH